MLKMWHHADKLNDFCLRLDKDNGIYQTGWCGMEGCEEKLKEYKATIRCLLNKKEHENCFACNSKSKTDIVIAKSY